MPGAFSALTKNDILDLSNLGITDEFIKNHYQDFVDFKGYLLVLSGNKITGNGLSSLLNAIQNKTTLLSLNLSGNPLLEKGATAGLEKLCRYLSNNALKLHSLSIKADQYQKLCRFARRRRQLGDKDLWERLNKSAKKNAVLSRFTMLDGEIIQYNKEKNLIAGYNSIKKKSKPESPKASAYVPLVVRLAQHRAAQELNGKRR